MLALFTGMRRNEVLALRWGRVDLDKGVIQVREALEATLAHGIRFKTPKSKAGRRDITLPDILIDVLREHRKAQLELRLRLGAGRLHDNDLLFADIDGNPILPTAFSTRWGEFAERIGMPELTFHMLRHTHASQLIDQGVDIVTISRRLGHWPRQTRHHPEGLCPPVPKGRQQGGGGNQRHHGVRRTNPAPGIFGSRVFLAPFRWQSGGNFTIRSFCSFASD
jgi:integrase